LSEKSKLETRSILIHVQRLLSYVCEFNGIDSLQNIVKTTQL